LSPGTLGSPVTGHTRASRVVSAHLEIHARKAPEKEVTMASERARPIPGAVFADHVASRLETKDLEATLATMAVESCVTRRPTLDGGVRTVEVRTFYDALI